MIKSFPNRKIVNAPHLIGWILFQHRNRIGKSPTYTVPSVEEIIRWSRALYKIKPPHVEMVALTPSQTVRCLHHVGLKPGQVISAERYAHAILALIQHADKSGDQYDDRDDG